ncbi:hypothetical protein QR680_011079 [Steinernema hermaphroditum]|uniref:Uncharacterized protein n=1 Tax=Steinernema hermaphroditum TaxID=289476 RepID=A0AA39ISI9_9BILA|nr:hypothetical protein QR680_011079 [Steinernema hermaphroditum]
MVDNARQLFRNIRARLSRSGAPVFEEQSGLLRQRIEQPAAVVTREEQAEDDAADSNPEQKICCHCALERIADEIEQKPATWIAIEGGQLVERPMECPVKCPTAPTKEESESSLISKLEQDMKRTYRKMRDSRIANKKSKWTSIADSECKKADETITKVNDLQKTIDELSEKLRTA